MKVLQFCVYIILTVLLLQGCTQITDTSSDNVTGELIWAGSPATDGAGMLFTSADTTYGIPGSRDDYARYFPTGENSVEIRAEIRLTDKTTVRGWGTRFPEVILSHIVVL